MKRGKPEYPEKKLSEQGREPTTNSTHIYGVDARIRKGEESALTAAPPVLSIMKLQLVKLRS